MYTNNINKDEEKVQLYCEECASECVCVAKKQEELFPVKGERVSVLSNAMVCSQCGTPAYYDKFEEDNLKQAYKKYRIMKGLLGPDDVKAIREKYGLSQRGISTLLGWSPATIARYEAGAIPSKGHNEQLRLFSQNPDYVCALFEEKKSQLGSLDIKRFEELKNKINEENYLESHLIRYYNRFPDKYRGNREFDLSRLLNMVIFYIENEAGIVKSKLLKLLWYADFLSFKTSGVSITGTPYCKNYFGPIPLDHESVIAYLQNIKAIDIVPFEGIYEGDSFIPLIKSDTTMFSDNEKKIMEYIQELFVKKTATELSEISHKEEAYTLTNFKEPISYEYSSCLSIVLNE